MSIEPKELGRAVRRWTHSDASFAVIAKTEAHEGGWGDGGCWILAAPRLRLWLGDVRRIWASLPWHRSDTSPPPRSGQGWEWFYRPRRLPERSDIPT